MSETDTDWIVLNTIPEKKVRGNYYSVRIYLITQLFTENNQASGDTIMTCSGILNNDFEDVSQ